MSIRMVDRGQQELPVVVCDHCGKPIRDARQGNSHWRYDAAGELTGDGMFFTHKQCCTAYEAALPRGVQAMSLDHWVYWLAKELKVDIGPAAGGKRRGRASTRPGPRRT